MYVPAQTFFVHVRAPRIGVPHRATDQPTGHEPEDKQPESKRQRGEKAGSVKKSRVSAQQNGAVCGRTWDCDSPESKKESCGPEGGQTPRQDMAHVGNGTADEEEEEVEVGVTLLYCLLLLLLLISVTSSIMSRVSGCAVNATPFNHPTAL